MDAFRKQSIKKNTTPAISREREKNKMKPANWNSLLCIPVELPVFELIIMVEIANFLVLKEGFKKASKEHF